MNINQSWRDMTADKKEEVLDSYLYEVKKRLMNENTLNLNISFDNEHPEKLKDGKGNTVNVPQVLSSKITFEYEHISE